MITGKYGIRNSAGSHGDDDTAVTFAHGIVVKNTPIAQFCSGMRAIFDDYVFQRKRLLGPHRFGKSS